MPTANPLVLEVMRQQDQLKMCLFSFKDFASTVRHYTQSRLAPGQIDGACKEIGALLNRAGLGGACPQSFSEEVRKNCHFLWEQLLSRQVKERLAATSAEDLVLLLDEELVNIPWELLYDGKEFLCLKFNLGRLLRASQQVPPPIFRSRPDSARRLKMLVMADPTADLKSSYQEGLAIKEMFVNADQPLAVDFKSTRVDSLFVKKYLRDYDLVHFAGHCSYDQDHPAKTGWELSDGRLTTEDVLSMGESAALPSLVFSNACQSAQVARTAADLDYSEKNYSLAAAFLFSGVRHYIGATRRIEDRTSLEFATAFYTQVSKGAAVGKALRSARRRLIEEHGKDSLCWASYLLYGDPSFAFFGAASEDAHPRLSGAGKVLGYLRAIPRQKAVITARIFLVCLLLVVLVWWLPSVNPSVYWRLHQAQRLARRGQNSRVVDIGKKIISVDRRFLPVYPLLAQSYERQGMRSQALQVYFDYAMLSAETSKNKHLAGAFNLIAWHYHQEAALGKAFEHYQKAIAVSRKSGDRLNEAVALRRLAVWHLDKGEDDRALELLTRSSEINRERQGDPQHRYNLACDYFDMGLVFSDKDDAETAREFYRKSMFIFRRINKKEELSDYYFNLGEIAVSEKDYQTALANYNRGLLIDQMQGNLPSIAVDYSMIGELYAEMDNFEKAEGYYKQAEQICRAIGIKPELADVCYNLGLLYIKQGLKRRAGEYLRCAQEILINTESPLYPRVKSAIESLSR